MKVRRRVSALAQSATLAVISLMAPPALASDFSGLFTIFIAMPVLVLLDFLLGVLLSCRVLQSRSRWGWAALIFCSAGVVASANWLALMSGGMRWHVVGLLVLLLVSLLSFSCLPVFRVFHRRFRLIMSRALLGIATGTSLLGLVEVTAAVSRGGDSGGLIVLLPMLFLLGIAFQLHSLLSRDVLPVDILRGETRGE